MKYSVSLTKNYEFRRLYNKGKSAATQSMVVYCRKTGYAKNTITTGGTRELRNRLGFTVSTKLGNAVRRNRIRRRLREVYRLSENKLALGYDIIVVARAAAFDVPFSQLQSEFAKNCHRLGLIVGQNSENAVNASNRNSKAGRKVE